MADINRRRALNGQTPKNEWSALAYGLQTLEDRLLRHLEDFLNSQGYRVDSYEFDGLMVRRSGETGAFPRAVLDEAERHLANQDLGDELTIAMRVEEKPLCSPYDVPPVGPALEQAPEDCQAATAHTDAAHLAAGIVDSMETAPSAGVSLE